YIPPEVDAELDPRFYQTGLSGGSSYAPLKVYATAVDPRTGNVFIGGQFFSVDNVQAQNIAFFDKDQNRWFSLSGGGLTEGSNQKGSYVKALAIHGSYLYVGGYFNQTENGVTTGLNRIARYNFGSGTVDEVENGTWTPFANGGLDGDVNAFHVSGTDLYVGGSFAESHDGNIPNLNNIAVYANHTVCTVGCWAALAGNGLNGAVNAMDSWGGGFYAGGEFTAPVLNPAMPLNRIARYSNGAWQIPPNFGLNGNVYSVKTTNDYIYVGGSFTGTVSPFVPLSRVGYYDESYTDSWQALDSGLNGTVKTISLGGPGVIVGGDFLQTADGLTELKSIACYCSGDWEAFPYDGLNGAVNAISRYYNIETDADLLYVGGTFTDTTADSPNPSFGVTSYSLNLNMIASDAKLGSTYSHLPMGLNNGKALNEQITALAADPAGNIYAGGYFTATADGATPNLNRIARYDPAMNTWSALANIGLNGTVTGLAISGNNLYVGGAFTATADGMVTGLNRIARYDLTTNTWFPLTNGGLNNEVASLVISGGNLYAGGSFIRTFDGTVLNLNRIARYNLTTNIWSPVAFNGVNDAVFTLAVSGDNLYAGGFFTSTFSFSNINLNFIARYNTVTNTWSPLANLGLSDYAEALAVTGNFMYVQGNFIVTGDGTKQLNGLARYDLQNNIWVTITGASDERSAARDTLATVQTGNEVYFGGRFHGAGDGVAHFFTRLYLQRWNVPAPTSDWFDINNWSTGAVPASNSSAVIPNGAGIINIATADVVMNDLNINGGTLNIATGRTLTVNGILNLKGGTITGDGTVVIANCQPDGIMGGDATAYIRTALVRCVNNTGTFTFPAGTKSGYAPVFLKNITGTGNILVRANQGPYSGPVMYLPTDRLRRWWQIENPGGGVTNSEVIFNYLQSDIVGNEASYRAYRISGGSASVFSTTANTFSNRVAVPNVTAYSDWTLADFGPTAASVSISGRVVTANGNGINKAIVTLTNQGGDVRRVITNSFGYYRFDAVEAGQTYVLSVGSKRYSFVNPTLVVSPTDDATDIDFMAEQAPYVGPSIDRSRTTFRLRK
ncbi:MAG: carboxypeptidase-like regulatory domain-containing protein, partial [Pyrinomonadaceae bacterium]